jgi:hypothetical protein
VRPLRCGGGAEGGAPELLQGLAQIYLGPDVKFPPLENGVAAGGAAVSR